jgi:hypothetical protein
MKPMQFFLFFARTTEPVGNLCCNVPMPRTSCTAIFGWLHLVVTRGSQITQVIGKAQAEDVADTGN